MCTYANLSNHSHYYTVQVIIELMSLILSSKLITCCITMFISHVSVPMYYTCHMYLYDVRHVCKITYINHMILTYNIDIVCVSQLRHTYQSHLCACMHGAGGLTVKIAMS